MKAIIVQTTCASKKEAKLISKVLVEKKLAACIQMTKIESMYIWDGKFCCDKEILLNIKAKKENFKKIEKKIKKLHSYDLPEIIQINIENASKEYLNFIENS